MDNTRAFLILGIPEGKEEREIKQAYREKLRFVNPEDNPEGFKELRSAYETALQYAQSKEEEPNETGDDTPEGRWESRLRQIYCSLPDRLNLDKWKELMEEEVCVALDSGEECRKRLLDFLMENFRLSTEVWRYLDQVWEFTGNPSQLYEEYPSNFADFLLSVCKDGSWFPLEAFTGPEEGNYDLYINLYFEMDNALAEGDTERAEALALQMNGLGISHPYGDLDFARLLLLKGEREQAEKLTQKACETLPKDDRVFYMSGLLYWDLQQKEQAAEQFQALLTGNPNNFTANKMLGKYWLEKNDLDKAKEYAIEAVDKGTAGGNRDPEVLDMLKTINDSLITRYRRIMEQDPDNFKNILELGWCYLQNDNLHQALSLLANRLPDEDNAEEYHNLMGKLYYNNQQNDRAMEHLVLWKEYLEKREASWKDQDPEEEERKKTIRRLITANGLLGRLYRLKWEAGKDGEFEKSLDCLNKTRDLGSQDPAYWMEKASLYKERGKRTDSNADYEEAVKILTEILEEDAGYFPAYVMRQECFAALRDARGVIEDYYQAKNIYAGYPPVYMAAAEVYNDLERWQDLQELLEEAEKNGAKTIPLKIYQCRMDRETSEGNEGLEKALDGMNALKAEMAEAKKQKADPEEREFTNEEEAKLEAEICITLSLLGKQNQALEAIKRAQKLDKKETRYHWIEGNLLRRQKRYEEAISAYDACRKDYEDSGIFYYYRGECYEGTGKRLQAVSCLKKALEFEPDHPEYLRKMTDLYQVLLDNTGKITYFEQGLPYANRRIEINPTTYDYVNRGLMYMTANRLEEALADFLKAGELAEENQFAWANVACAYKKMGQYEKALYYIKKAISLMESEPTTYFYETLGRIYTCMGEDGKALEAHLENFRRYPANYSVAEKVSGAYANLGRYPEAIEMWRSFFPSDRDAEYYDEIADLLILMKEYKKAEEAIEKAVPYSGKGKAALRQTVVSIHQNKRVFLGMSLEKTVKAFEKKSGSDFCTAAKMTALYFWLKGKKEKAARYTGLYRECLMKDYGGVSAEAAEENCVYTRIRWYRLAVLSLLEGNVCQAEEYGRKLSECHWCSHCDEHMCMEEQMIKGLLAWADGKKEEALAFTGQVLEDCSTFEDACILNMVIKGV